MPSSHQSVDLGLQVRQGDDPAGGGQSAVVLGQLADDAASSDGGARAAKMVFESGGFGLEAAKK
jgi:hypothetical protein